MDWLSVITQMQATNSGELSGLNSEMQNALYSHRAKHYRANLYLSMNYQMLWPGNHLSLKAFLVELI